MASRRYLRTEEDIWNTFDGLPSDPSNPDDPIFQFPLDYAPDDENEPMDIDDDDLHDDGSTEDDSDNEWEDVEIPEVGWERYDETRHKLASFTFTGRHEFLCPDMNMNTPMEYFQLFYTNDLLQNITDETNRFTEAKINLNRPLQQYSFWHDWVSCTVE